MTTAIAQSLTASLLHFVWQGLLVAFLLWVALFMLRKRSANSRYQASCVALAVLAVLPAVTAAVLFTRPAAQRPAGESITTTLQTIVAERVGAVSPAPWLAAWQAWVVPAWSIGVLLFSLRLVSGCVQVSSLRRRGMPAQEPLLEVVGSLARRLAIARRVRVLITSAADGPSVVGWLRPVILLPSATLLGLTPDQLEAVLAHEVAHIRRHDYIMNVLQVLVETLLFYHPAVWWVSSRIRQERELCCDDLAVRVCGDALCYARALTRIERLRLTSPAMAMASTGGPLLYRIQRLIGSGQQDHGPSKIPGILALCLGLACLGITVHRAHGQEQERKTAVAFMRDGPLTPDGPVTRDGAGVSVDLGAAAVLHRTSVEYPRSAIEKSIEGIVTVEATLDAAGNVADAHVLGGPMELRRSALRSVFEWHFLPEVAGSIRQVSIAFHLAEAKNQEVTGLDRENSRTVTYNGQPFSVRVEPRLELRGNEVALGDLPASDEEAKRLEGQMQELRGKIASVPRSDQTQDAAREFLEAQVKELEQRELELQSGRISLVPELSPSSAAGHKLARIEARGFSSQVREALLSRLPVHLGDTLSQQTLEDIAAAVRKFDEHVELKIVQLETGEIAIRIVAPESEGGRNEEFDDALVREYVNRLAQNTVRNSDGEVPFTFRVIEDGSPDAVALPGGLIFVNTAAK